MRRLFDGLLIVALVVGGVASWRTGRERGRLASEHLRLVRLIGDLPIGDPSRVHVRALETGEPLHFAWRIYLPAHYRFEVRSRRGNHNTATAAEPVEFLARVRFREAEGGALELYQKFWGGSSRGGLGDRSLAELLHGRWGRVRVEQLGAPDVATLGPGDRAVLLRLRLPADLEAEARAKLSPNTLEAELPVIFQVEIGPEPTRPAPPPGN